MSSSSSSSSRTNGGRTRVGKYELGKTLGEGTFAKVKFARNVVTGDNVAIKILDKDKILKHKMINQIKREISTMKLIRHPNVIRMYEVMASKTKVYIVLEFVTGGELFDKIATKGRLKEDEARKYFQQLIDAVDYCHSREVDGEPRRKREGDGKPRRKREDDGRPRWNREDDGNRGGIEMTTGDRGGIEMTTPRREREDDGNNGNDGTTERRDRLNGEKRETNGEQPRSTGKKETDGGSERPENLLLDASGILKVSDFGLSALPQQVREDGLLHTTCGTPNYVAPEVINDKGYDGAIADLWSCGVILFVLMAGFLPFEESNLHALYKKINKAEFTTPPWFSTSVKKLIRRILDPNPLTRITISEVIENEWFKKGYKRPVFEQANVSLADVDAIFNDSLDSQNLVVERREEGPIAPVTMNAFELISTSQGLNLSTLFEKQMGLVKRETRFTSKHSANEIISKIEQAAVPLGFNVKKNNYKVKLQGEKSGRKGHVSIATEIFQVAPELYMVEVRKSEGDTLEFHKFYKDLSTGLKDIVWKSSIDEEKEAGKKG
ncbi:hypothetical protein ACFE04_029761 [Oxalis oulophora]